jgi:hypothetical protein
MSNEIFKETDRPKCLLEMMELQVTLDCEKEVKRSERKREKTKLNKQ